MYKCLPPGGRGTALAVEGACVNDKQYLFDFTRSPSVAFARTPKKLISFVSGNPAAPAPSRREPK